MPNITRVNICWNRSWESRHGLWDIDSYELQELDAAGTKTFDYILILKAESYGGFLEFVISWGRKRKKYGSSLFSLDDSTLALLLLHC